MTPSHRPRLLFKDLYVTIAAVLLFIPICPSRGYTPAAAAASTPHMNTCLGDQQCLNGGRCRTVYDDDAHTSFQHCQCLLGFTGPRCERSCPLACQNGGRCERQQHKGDDDDAVCKCFGAFTGPLCQVPYVNCGGSIQCWHGGKCVAVASNSSSMRQFCNCPDGYSGPFCEAEPPESSNRLGDPLIESQPARISTTFLLIVLVGCVTLLLAWQRRQHLRKLEKWQAVATAGRDGCDDLDAGGNIAEHDLEFVATDAIRARSRGASLHQPLQINVV